MVTMARTPIVDRSDKSHGDHEHNMRPPAYSAEVLSCRVTEGCGVMCGLMTDKGEEEKAADESMCGDGHWKRMREYQP